MGTGTAALYAPGASILADIQRSGFGSEETIGRSFLRLLGVRLELNHRLMVKGFNATRSGLLCDGRFIGAGQFLDDRSHDRVIRVTGTMDFTAAFLPSRN
jgi:hypothetical protein